MQNYSTSGKSRSSSNGSNNRRRAPRLSSDSLTIIGGADTTGHYKAGGNGRRSAGAANTAKHRSGHQKRLMRRLRRDVIYIAVFLAAFAGALFIIRTFSLSGEEQTVEAQKISSITLTEEALNAETEDSDSLNAAEDGLSALTIVVDPGHGGKDPGCMSGSVYECDINLAVALKVAAYLEEYDINVIMTRTEDEFLSLIERVTIANEAEADYFVSLHCNTYDDDSSVSGLECYYCPDMEDGEAFAAAIVEYMKENSDIKVRKYEDNDLFVLHNTNMTAVLIEMGYMSSPTELANLTSDAYQSELAQAIVEGIIFAVSQE